MSDGTLERLLGEVGKVLSPLESGLSESNAPAFFASLGIAMTPAQASALASSFTSVRNGVGVFVELLNELTAAIEADDTGAILEKAIRAVVEVAKVIDGFSSIASTVSALPGVTPAVVNALPERIFSLLLSSYLGRNVGVNEVLELTGILEREDFNVTSTDPALPFYTVDTFHFGRIGGWLSGPGDQLASLYDWGTPAFDGTKLLPVLDRLIALLGLPALLDTSGAVPVLDLVAVEIKPRTDLTPRGLSLELKSPTAPATIEFTGEDWTLTLSVAFSLLAGAEVIVQPDGKLTLEMPDSTTVSGKVGVAYSHQRPADRPLVLLGVTGGSGISVREVGAGIAFELRWDGSRASGGIEIGGDLKNGLVKLGSEDGDGFLNSILSGLDVESRFDVGFTVSSSEGLHFHGSSTLEIQLASHIELGPIELTALTLSLGISGSEFPIAISTNIKAALGPLAAVVEEMGFEVALELVDGNSGNLGPVDIDFGFKPPKGVGLSLDVGVVKGGGYLFFDFDNEEYAGALEFDFAGIVTVKAIGLITTRMPDGSKGFSLLIIITAEFGNGIQLGFGFVLLGVGGLLGLNRTMKLQPLLDGVRTGAIESVMFPQDVVANAPRIISDLRTFFPAAVGIFLIGPMAKVGWGTPALIRLSLGIIIEIPGNIAILGVLKVVLPDEEASLLVLQVNFFGAIEFDKKRAYFFAAMFESRVLFMTLEGEMGVLVAWGSDSNFVVSVGGFHPQFNPPPLPFPSPKRISISVLNESWGRIRVQGYFAVTSNTVQFGARAELFFGFSALSIEGHLAFDALFQFSPFFFIIEISAGVSLKVFGIGLFSIDLRFSLEGPSPWRAKGYGKLKLLFFSIKANFDFTWGEAEDTVLEPIAVLPLLVAELEKNENWRALPPPANQLYVSLRKLSPEDGLVLHGVGRLEISQRAVPLDLTLDKVGNQKPSDGKKFSLVATGGLAKSGDVDEQFAIAQYQDFKDAEKLSKPAYQPEHGGVELAPANGAFKSGKVAKRKVRYETILLDGKYKRFVIVLSAFAERLFNLFLGGNAVSRAEVSHKHKQQMQPFEEKIALHPDVYAVAFNRDNTVYRETALFSSEASAREFLTQEVARDAKLRHSLHVIPGFELKDAADRRHAA